MDIALSRSTGKEGRGQDGFDAFDRDTWDHTYRTLAVIIRDHELAREAVDEAMVRALGKWHSLSESENRSGWVYRTAFNWALDQIRRRKRETTKGVLDVTHWWEPIAPRPDLAEKVNELSLEQRAVVVLRVVNDWSESEVAEALGIPVGTVKSRLSRALAVLRLEVDDL